MTLYVSSTCTVVMFSSKLFVGGHSQDKMVSDDSSPGWKSTIPQVYSLDAPRYTSCGTPTHSPVKKVFRLLNDSLGPVFPFGIHPRNPILIPGTGAPRHGPSVGQLSSSRFIIICRNVSEAVDMSLVKLSAMSVKLSEACSLKLSTRERFLSTTSQMLSTATHALTKLLAASSTSKLARVALWQARIISCKALTTSAHITASAEITMATNAPVTTSFGGTRQGIGGVLEDMVATSRELAAPSR
mmetsp:Transcript_33625/g.56488  ORF Transcript_33625/g.56488 Transcript_33625/m.56488 type:complete len:243 (-) Transcript_33625:468-1196(-)|eukprot:CAMPEP_0198213016 /NCGR_PEP_ID=MMETSP1445-20131203/28629_1 /TAXON_ID=36898 /ORGANISM="Pyramimonas sp., Strain CCMP2087" /LENGTH=242 /DNA_ID=CAMNT_0043887605 /DNA_START=159 /DNA_END=887 /DNA_ORIENTATION=-